jgi:hypothetical protein
MDCYLIKTYLEKGLGKELGIQPWDILVPQVQVKKNIAS